MNTVKSTHLNCTLKWFSGYSQLCNTIINQTIFITSNRNSIPVVSLLSCTRNSNKFTLCLKELHIWGISCKQNHAIRSLLCHKLLALSIFRVHPCCSSVSTVYGWVVFCYMDRLHFVYPLSGDRCLCCFHFLASTNNTAMNVRVLLFVCGRVFSNLFGIYLGVELLFIWQLYV